MGSAGRVAGERCPAQDLYGLIREQVLQMDAHSGKTYNMGGGAECSVSLAELTEIGAERTDQRVAITSQPETNPVDVPYYITDDFGCDGGDRMASALRDDQHT